MTASGPVDSFHIPRKGPPIRLLTSKHLPMGPNGEICSGKKRGEKEKERKEKEKERKERPGR